MKKDTNKKEKTNEKYDPTRYETEFPISKYVRTLMRSKFTHEYLSNHN